MAAFTSVISGTEEGKSALVIVCRQAKQQDDRGKGQLSGASARSVLIGSNELIITRVASRAVIPAEVGPENDPQSQCDFTLVTTGLVYSQTQS